MSIDRETQLETENRRLLDRVRTLESRCGHLMVDADRREERARKEAHDCAEHGREIQYLRHMASWQWSSAQESDSAYRGLISALILVQQRMGEQPVESGVLASWIGKAIDAGNKHIGKKRFPSLADCQRAGGCDHDGLCDGLKADIADALGIAPASSAAGPCAQGELFDLGGAA